MKLTSIIFTTLLAVASIEGAPVTDPALGKRFCEGGSKLCHIINGVINGPSYKSPSFHGQCYLAGENCSAKRAADDAAEAIADHQVSRSNAKKKSAPYFGR